MPNGLWSCLIEGGLMRYIGGEAPHGSRRDLASHRSSTSERVIRVIAALSVMNTSNNQIGSILNVTPSYVSTLKRTDLYRDFEQEIMKLFETEAAQVGKKIQELSLEAIRFYEKVLTQNEIGGRPVSLSMRAKIAEDLLNKAGHKEPQRVISEGESDEPWALIMPAEEYERMIEGDAEAIEEFENADSSIQPRSG